MDKKEFQPAVQRLALYCQSHELGTPVYKVTHDDGGVVRVMCQVEGLSPASAAGFTKEQATEEVANDIAMYNQLSI